MLIPSAKTRVPKRLFTIAPKLFRLGNQLIKIAKKDFFGDLVSTLEPRPVRMIR